jgi:hypothetical protein
MNDVDTVLLRAHAFRDRSPKLAQSTREKRDERERNARYADAELHVFGLAIAVTLWSTIVGKPGRPSRCASYVGGRDCNAAAQWRTYEHMCASNSVNPADWNCLG